MSERRYIVTVRDDSAHGLEIHMQSATRVILGAHAPYPRGGGTDVLSVERADERPAMLWDGHDRPACPDCEGRGTQLSQLDEAIHRITGVDAITAQSLAGDVLAKIAATTVELSTPGKQSKPELP